jgi:hypothetical protein
VCAVSYLLKIVEMILKIVVVRRFFVAFLLGALPRHFGAKMENCHFFSS